MVTSSDGVVKKLQDALALLRVELAQFAVNLGGEFNPPGHAASEHLRVGWSARPRCGCDSRYVRPDTSPQGRQGAQEWLRGRRKSWCGRCGGRAFSGGFCWVRGGEVAAWEPPLSNIVPKPIPRLPVPARVI